MLITASIILSFVIGSIPFGYLISRAKGVDIRKHGSGNIGATNVNRNLGKKAGALTLALDLLKGILGTQSAAILTCFFGQVVDLSNTTPFLGFVTVLAHCYTPWLKGKGGKGVATGLGVFLTIAPGSTLIALAIFAFLLKASAVVALGSIFSALSLPLLMYFEIPAAYAPANIFAASLTAILIVIRHRENIGKLIVGTGEGNATRSSQALRE